MSFVPAGPLILSRDEALVAELTRLSAAANVVPVVVRDAPEALPGWLRAPAVLVGADLAAEAALLAPPRRDGVYVLCLGPPPDPLFRHAIGCAAETVLVLPAAEERVIELFTDLGDRPAGGPGAADAGLTVSVIGAAGGVGASVFAAALGLTLAKSRPTLLVDADPLGTGLDRVLGWEDRPGVRWDALSRPTGRLGARALRESLPKDGDLAVLTWPVRNAEPVQVPALREVLSAGVRGFSAVVVDLPRHGGDAVAEVIGRSDRVVLVSTSTLPSLAAAARLVPRLPSARIGLVLRGRPGAADPGAVGRALGVPVWTQMTDQRRLDEDLGLGLGPLRSPRGPLARAGRRVAAALEAAP